MKKNRILSLLLSGLMLFGFGACSNEVEPQKDLTESEIAALGDKVPDYSNSGKKFDFVGYGMGDGYWIENGVEMYCGRDMYTVEDFTIYKEAGFTYMHPQGAAGIQAVGTFVFEASPLKRVMDTAMEAGIGRVIVPDYRIYELISLISMGVTAAEQNAFATYDDYREIFTDDGQLDQTAVENRLKEYMGEYSQHPAFYGVVLRDEPAGDNFVGYGEVYRTIKRLYPDAFMLCNVLPPAGFTQARLGPFTVTQEEIDEFKGLGFAERLAMWKKYITMYLDITQCEYLMYDQYPIGEDEIHELYLRGLQIAAEVCKEKGVQLYFVAQTTAIATTRVVNAEDAAWLNNMLLGLGVKSIAYWTYYVNDETAAGKTFYEWGSFVTHFGERTPLYYIMQDIMAKNQKMAPTMLCFDYQTSAVYSSEIVQYGAGYLNNSVKSTTFAKVSDIHIDKESALISELYDKTGNRYMYMIQNVVNPDFTGSGSWQTTTITFNEKYKYALVLCDGEQKVVQLSNNKYSITQHPGKAVFVIPFNA